MPIKKKISKNEIKKAIAKDKPLGKYFEAVGRRKTATARIRVWVGTGSYRVNEKNITDYFSEENAFKKLESPFKKLGVAKKYNFSAKVSGGGKKAQLDAIVHGISRAMVKVDESFKKTLKKEGYLTRDPRMKERKKYGLKRARRAPQWSKR